MTSETINIESTHDNITETDIDFTETNDTDLDTQDITENETMVTKRSDKCKNSFTSFVQTNSFKNCSQASSFLQTHCSASVDVKSKIKNDYVDINQDTDQDYNGTDINFFQFHGEAIENLSHNLTSYSKDEDCCDVMDAVKILRIMLAFIKDDMDIISEISVKKSKSGWDYKLNSKTISMKNCSPS